MVGLRLEESSLSAGVWIGARKIPGSLGELWSCLCLKVQVGIYTFFYPAPRLCSTMQVYIVCGPAGWQFRAQGGGSRWERQMPKALRMETWAGLLGMEPWSQMDLDWLTGSMLLFPGRAGWVCGHSLLVALHPTFPQLSRFGGLKISKMP